MSCEPAHRRHALADQETVKDGAQGPQLAKFREVHPPTGATPMTGEKSKRD